MAHLGDVGTALKIAFDFCTIGPPLIFSFLYWSKLWESGFDHGVTLHHSLERFPSTLVASYAFWAPLHFMTYGLVPLRHRCVCEHIVAIRFGTLRAYLLAVRTLSSGSHTLPSMYVGQQREQNGLGLRVFSGFRGIAFAFQC